MSLPKTARRVSAAVLLAVAAGSVLYWNRPESSASTQSTDDAYVQADFTLVAPRVAGVIEHVLVDEHQSVQAGDVLAVIDARDYAVALAAAHAEVAAAEASVAGLRARLAQQQHAIAQVQATLAADEAELTLAHANQERYRSLAADGVGSVQARQQAEAQWQVRSANRDKNRAALHAARQQTDVLRADLTAARAALAQAQSARDAAELKLSYTRISAPISGVIGQKAARVGAFVNVGAPLLAVIPLDALYITAHFRETQLARVRAGQSVEITVDALPGITLTGSVASLGPASGVSYSTIAPHNASGNFTKIVQRLPVRIQLDPAQLDAAQLRVGMSVTPKIHLGG